MFLKKIIFVFVLLSPISLLAQKNLDTLTKKMGNKIYVEIIDESERIVQDGFLSKNKKEGIWTTFYRDGAPKMIQSFVDDIPAGKLISFNEEKGVDKIENYSNGILEGPARYYHGNGKLKATLFYSDGLVNGFKKSYFANGQLEESGRFKNGARDGAFEYFYKSGKKSAVYHFENDIKNGLASFYNEAGYISSMGKFRNNEKDGVWKEFHITGIIKEEGKYSKGIKKGVWKQYDKKGKFTQNKTY